MKQKTWMLSNKPTLKKKFFGRSWDFVKFIIIDDWIYLESITIKMYIK